MRCARTDNGSAASVAEPIAKGDDETHVHVRSGHDASVATCAARLEGTYTCDSITEFPIKSRMIPPRMTG